MEESTETQVDGSKKSQKTLMIGAGMVVIALVVGGGVFLSGNRSQSPATQSQNEGIQATSAPSSVVEEEVGEESTEAIREVSVEGKEFSFSPSSLTVKKGEKIKIVFKNVGKMPHDFVVEELNVKTKVINGGQTNTVEFTVPIDASELTYYCSVGNHRKQGMEGKISIQ